MALPAFDFFMSPVLKALYDGNTYKTAEIRERVKGIVKLPDEDYSETIPSGQNKFDNRVGWAITYLRRGRLIESPQRGRCRITGYGKEVFDTHGMGLNKELLMEISEGAREFCETSQSKSTSSLGQGEGHTIQQQELESFMTPRERMESAMEELNDALSSELLDKIYDDKDWGFFERMVLKLLQAMGYGADANSLRVTGGSGDGGIDGEILQDKLGFDKIYVQAKHYSRDRTIGPETIRGFIGALSVNGGSKGVFITTSGFTKQAIETAEKSSNVKIILIDGRQLAELMIRYNVGVTVSETYVVKKIDSDFFEDE